MWLSELKSPPEDQWLDWNGLENEPRESLKMIALIVPSSITDDQWDKIEFFYSLTIDRQADETWKGLVREKLERYLADTHQLIDYSTGQVSSDQILMAKTVTGAIQSLAEWARD